VDPLAAKYPHLSPYNYVANNPMIFVDPNGKYLDDFTVRRNGTIEWTVTRDDHDRFYVENKKGALELAGVFCKNADGLIQLPSQFTFFSDDPRSSFGFSSKDAQESFVSGVGLAALMGALSETNTWDMTITSASLEDGSSPITSRTHFGGVNFDMRYLKTNYSGDRGELQDVGIDVLRQNTLNEAMHKFGWKQLMSEVFAPDGLYGPYFLSRTTHDVKGKHCNHQHQGNFQPHLIVNW